MWPRMTRGLDAVAATTWTFCSVNESVLMMMPLPTSVPALMKIGVATVPLTRKWTAMNAVPFPNAAPTTAFAFCS